MPSEQTIAICVSGALGGVGRRLVAGVDAAEGFTLHSAVARREAGRDVGEVVLGRPLGVPITTGIPRDNARSTFCRTTDGCV